MHIIQQCEQNWFSVLYVLEATISEIKLRMPSIEEIFLRSDNAGCYHCAPLLLSIPTLAKRMGLPISRYDFSEEQAGKGLCDRKIAPMKANIQRYVNEGYDVTNAEEMYTALESYGGVRGCYVAVALLDESSMTDKISWPGITTFTNFQVEESGIRATKGYLIEPSNFKRYDEILKKSPTQGPTNVRVSHGYSEPGVHTGQFGHSEQVTIPCTDVACVKIFHSQDALTQHVAVGTHLFKPTTESKLDTIARKWALKVTDVAATSQQLSLPASERLR